MSGGTRRVVVAAGLASVLLGWMLAKCAPEGPEAVAPKRSGDASSESARGGTGAPARRRPGRAAAPQPPPTDVDIAADAAPEPTTVRARVVREEDEERLPIEGARVAVVVVGRGDDETPRTVRLDGPRTTASATTGADGAFALDVASDAEHLLVTAPAFVARLVRVAAAAGGEDVVLRPAVDLDGRVVDADGRGIAGAFVTCNAALDAVGVVAEATTDARGAFRFAVGGGDEVWLRGRADGYGPRSAQHLAGDAPARIVLERAAWIEGRVVDASGAAVREFEARPSGRDLGDGRFEIGPLAPGVQEVRIVRPGIRGLARSGQVASDVFVLAAGERRSGVVLTLPGPGSVLRVRVVDPRGRPVEHALVRIAESAGGREPSWPRSDAQGLAACASPAPAGTPVTVVVHPPAGASEWVRGAAARVVTGAHGSDAAPTDVALAAGRVVLVRLTDAQGELDPGARLAAVEGEGYHVRNGRLVAAPGVLMDLPVETDRGPVLLRGVVAQPAADGVVTLRLPAAVRVRGRVVPAPGTAPQGLRVGITVHTSHGHVFAKGGRPDDDGRFGIEVAPEGAARLVASGGGTQEARRTFDLAGADVDLGDVVLTTLVPVTGTVVGDDGRGVGEVLVEFDAGEFEARATTASDGTFALRAPDGCGGTLLVYDDPWHAPGIATTASAGAAPVRLRVSRKATIVVRGPFPGDESVATSVRHERGGDDVTICRTRHGRALALDVPPGAWDVRVAFDGRTWVRSVSVGADGAVEVTLDD